MKKLAFFPGKFQPPHIGHVLTISKLLKSYNIIIGISPDKPRVASQHEVKDTFKTIFCDRVQYFIFNDVLTNYTSISQFPKFDVLLTGNNNVINWAKKLKVSVKKISRSECVGASGTGIRRMLEYQK